MLPDGTTARGRKAADRLSLAIWGATLILFFYLATW
jgi:hypothetical protein